MREREGGREIGREREGESEGGREGEGGEEVGRDENSTVWLVFSLEQKFEEKNVDTL